MASSSKKQCYSNKDALLQYLKCIQLSTACAIAKKMCILGLYFLLSEKCSVCGLC